MACATVCIRLVLNHNNKTMSNNIQYNSKQYKKRLLTGLFLLAVGSAYLLRNLDLLFFPDWLFTWPVILIIVGLVSGIKHNFSRPGAFALIFIGSIFLLDQAVNIHIAYLFWPVMLIAIGLRLIIFKESRWCRERWEMRKQWHQKMHHQCHNAV